MRACSAPRADQEAGIGKGTGWRCLTPISRPNRQTLTITERCGLSAATEFVTLARYS